MLSHGELDPGPVFRYERGFITGMPGQLPAISAPPVMIVKGAGKSTGGLKSNHQLFPHTCEWKGQEGCPFPWFIKNLHCISHPTPICV